MATRQLSGKTTDGQLATAVDSAGPDPLAAAVSSLGEFLRTVPISTAVQVVTGGLLAAGKAPAEQSPEVVKPAVVNPAVVNPDATGPRMPAAPAAARDTAAGPRTPAAPSAARDTGPAPTAAAKVDTPQRPALPIIGQLTDHAQLAVYYQLGAQELSLDLNGVVVDKELDARARQWLDRINRWAADFATTKAEKISDADTLLTKQLFDEGARIRRDIRAAREDSVRAAGVAFAKEVETIVAEVAAVLETLTPHIKDLERAAFQADDSSTLAAIVEYLGNAFTIGLALDEIARDIGEATGAAQAYQLPAISKWVKALGYVNVGLAALGLALSVKDEIWEIGRTELDDALRKINLAAGAFSSATTLAGLPGIMTIWAAVYLVPMTKACGVMAQRISQFTHEENELWVELVGAPLRMAVELGGEEMWKFMREVMRASDLEQVPTPSSTVRAYFVEHRRGLDAGVGAPTSAARLPVTGLPFFKRVAEDDLREWVFAHRDQVWTLLYGRIIPPQAPGVTGARRSG
jgi:hypothetical protein